jgi:hypothetical protein
MAENIEIDEQLKAYLKQRFGSVYIKSIIKNHYREDYANKIAAEKPGLTGKFMRLVKSSRTGNIMAGVVTATALALAGVAVMAAPALPFMLIPLGALAASLALMSVSDAQAKSLANKAMDKGIANGTLITKYNTEVVNKQRQELSAAQAAQREERAALSEKLSRLAEEAKAKFNSAATAEAAATPAAKPARQHWYSLRR